MNPLTDTNCTYFLCPDKRCKLFTAPGRVPCERDCPKAKRMRKAIVCGHCLKVVKLPADHFSFCRVDCPHCGAANFQRMSGVYRRVNV